MRELDAIVRIITAASPAELRAVLASPDLEYELKLTAAIIRAAEYIKANREKPKVASLGRPSAGPPNTTPRRPASN